jgi:hypothetical protein
MNFTPAARPDANLRGLHGSEKQLKRGDHGVAAKIGTLVFDQALAF